MTGRRRLQSGKATSTVGGSRCSRCGGRMRKSKSSIKVRFRKARPAKVETMRATVCENGHLPYATTFLDAIGVEQIGTAR